MIRFILVLSFCLCCLGCTIRVIQAPPENVAVDTLWMVPHKGEAYFRYLQEGASSRNYTGYRIVDSVTIDVSFLINEVHEGDKPVTVEYVERYKWDTQWNCWSKEESKK